MTTNYINNNELSNDTSSLIATWENGTIMDLGKFSLESEKLIMMAELKNWCKEKKFKMPSFSVVKNKEKGNMEYIR